MEVDDEKQSFQASGAAASDNAVHERNPREIRIALQDGVSTVANRTINRCSCIQNI